MRPPSLLVVVILLYKSQCPLRQEVKRRKGYAERREVLLHRLDQRPIKGLLISTSGTIWYAKQRTYNPEITFLSMERCPLCTNPLRERDLGLIQSYEFSQNENTMFTKLGITVTQICVVRFIIKNQTSHKYRDSQRLFEQIS